MPGGTFSMPVAYAASAMVVSDGVMSITGPNPRLLNSATAAFTPQDVGKRITVAGAGAAGADLITTIARRLSATQVELTDPALTAVGSADLSYVKGVYRLSQLIAQGDVGGNRYQVAYARRLQLQLGTISPGGSLFVGGPYVSPTNHGMEINDTESDNFTPGDRPGVTTSDYLCSDTALQLVNIYWVDDLSLSTPA